MSIILIIFEEKKTQTGMVDDKKTQTWNG